MRTVESMLRAALKIDIPYEVQLSLIESREEYIRIQQQQMKRGERSDSHPIFNLQTFKDTYSDSYAKYKGKYKPIDLRDTGAFQGDIFVEVENAKEAIVDSADEKSDMLQERYGPQIFTLNKESRIEFKPIAQEALISLIKKGLNKV